MSAETDQYFSLHAQSFLKYFSSVTSRSRVFVIFSKVLEPVSEKFGTEKVLESVSEKVWYQKSPGIGRRNIWSRSRNLPVSILSHLTFSKNITFCILSSEFWCWFGSWYRPRPFPGTFESQMRYHLLNQLCPIGNLKCHCSAKILCYHWP